MTDPRLGRPSASSMWRVANCFGSQTLITSLRQVGKYYELPSREAQSGDRIHNFLAFDALGGTAQAGDFIETMTADERAVAKKAAEIRDQLVNEWLGGKPANGKPIIEKRFYYRQGITARFSGQPDYVLIDGTRALDINYKTGRKEALSAADNLQLRTEIVLLKHNYPELTEISGVIDEPFVTWDPERVIYREADLLKAENQILGFVDRADWEKETRVPGPWCEYCPARAYCREARGYIQTIPNPEVGAIMEQLPRGELGVQLWEKIKVAKKLLATLEETYEKILEDEPDALPGYLLPKEGKARRIVPYPAKLKTALAAYLNDEEIDGCAEYRLGKIEELIGIKHRIDDKTQVSKIVKELTGDAVTIIHDKPFIRPLTKKERQAQLTNGR